MIAALLLFAQAAPAATPAIEAPRVLERCPTTPTGEVVVCGRAGEDRRYRLPPPSGNFDPHGDTPSVHLERRMLLDVGAVGIHSCSPAGPGGWTGCDLMRWRQAQDQFAGTNRADRDRPSISLRVGRMQASE